MLIPLGILASSGGAAGSSYELISTAYGTGSVSTLTFSSIPQTYKHLQVRYTVRLSNATWDSFSISLSQTRSHQIRGSFEGVLADEPDYPAQFTRGAPNNSSISGAHKAGIIDILDYSVTTKNKTIRAFYGGHADSGNNGNNAVVLRSGFSIDTAAISTLSFSGWNGSNFSSTTRFSLYGIKG
jgi:hypothetical protein